MLSSLTKAERRVYDCFLEGMQIKEAANVLCISPTTVASHRRYIFEKLEVSSIQQLLSKHIKEMKKIIEDLRKKLEESDG